MANDENDDVDPLDAFMAAEVLPEVAVKQDEEARQREAERQQIADALAQGRSVGVSKAITELDEEEQKPDAVLTVPGNKVKLVVGPGGDKVREIQKRSKVRI